MNDAWRCVCCSLSSLSNTCSHSILTVGAIRGDAAAGAKAGAAGGAALGAMGGVGQNRRARRVARRGF